MEMNLTNEQLDLAIMVTSMSTGQGSRILASKLQNHWRDMQEPGDPATKKPLSLSEDECRIGADACALSNDAGADAMADMFAAGAGEGYVKPVKPTPPEPAPVPETPPADPDLDPQPAQPAA